jgi:hypothetical protein
MAIEVTCPGCKKTFRVSDQFAGKKGPCPDCKTVITIPTERVPEVVIHAPESSGPTDSKGRPVLKPLRRNETKLTPVMLGGIIGGVVLALAGALVLRMAFPDHNIPLVALGLGAIVLAPPLVIGGYSFLRDQELEPYRGTAVMIRTAICSAVYAALWGLYAAIPWMLGLDALELPSLVFIVPLMAVAGGFAAFATFDLEFGTGVMHYGLYLLVTVLLCFVAGWPLWA